MAERQRQPIDPEVERQIAVQNELEWLAYWCKEDQYEEIEPAKFPHLRRDQVALARYNTADSYANKIQTFRHISLDPNVQMKLDILTTSIYKESEKKLDHDLGDIEGEADLELIRRRAALVISSDFNSSLDRAIVDGDEKRIDRSNFPGLRAMDDMQILQDKLRAVLNKIAFLERMEKMFRPAKIGYIEEGQKDQEEIAIIRERFEKDLKKAQKRLLELSKRYVGLE
ncbi:hypothetical protein HYW46_07260 [Candidatus Daviesbacteria bacterium]|nr:hypothetical protein [Candidatus Daviesbacteria bacterium]